MLPDNLYYNKSLKLTAIRLRKEMTKAEAALWKYVLKAGNMKGYTFNREHPVITYIADFMCKKLSLIIEVDGVSHLDEKVFVRDVERGRILRSAGFRILRFSDNEILQDIDRVGLRILEEVEEIEKSIQKNPPPTPLQRGEKKIGRKRKG